MEKPFFFFLFLLLVEWEVGAVVQQNERNIENTNFLVKNERRQRRFFDGEPYEEGSTKWNIDLADMLHFDRLESEFNVDGKRLSKDDLERLMSRGKNEEKEAAEETEENDEYEEEDINALMDQYDDEDFRNQIQEYVLRYVNLFLNLLNLQDKKALDEGDEEVVDFNFVITGKDLKALQDLSTNFEERNIFDQLYLIDSIISKGIRVKEKYSFYQDITGFLSKAEFPREFFISKGSYFYIFAGVGVSMILAKNLINISYKLIAFILINNMILMEGLFNYFRKVKEANIADYVDRMRYSTEVDACSPAGQSIFGKLYNMLYENQCLTYHKNLQLNRADSIFPLESILNAYAFYFVEIPCKILGSGINAFVVSVNAYLPVIVRQLGEVTTQFCVMGFLVFAFVVYFAAPQFTFALLGARLHINFGRLIMRPIPINRNPRQYRRIRHIPRSALNEIEIEERTELLADRLGEGSHSIYEEFYDDVEEERLEIEEVGESSTEEEIEILDEDNITDNDSFTPDEKNSSEDVETAEGLSDELKTDE